MLVAHLPIDVLAQPGAPIIWGGAPAIFDMRQGTTPMGAVETAMISARYGYQPRVAWVPERVWEQSFTRDLVDAGIVLGNQTLHGWREGTARRRRIGGRCGGGSRLRNGLFRGERRRCRRGSTTSSTPRS